MALCSRFTPRDGAGEAFDELVREAAAAVLEREPGTLVYACSEVEERRTSDSSSSCTPTA
ncbi:hypothetical protein [Streptomyces hirsutus]|uniref:hypothetical protein n=1 Tax=Streptomyces hirsutus TaxID=35620 RepID=UPI00369D47D3